MRNGTPMLTKITAAGCSLNAYIAAVCAAHPRQLFEATVAALAAYECAPLPDVSLLTALVHN